MIEDLRKFVMHIQGFLIILTFNLYSFVCGNHEQLYSFVYCNQINKTKFNNSFEEFIAILYSYNKMQRLRIACSNKSLKKANNNIKLIVRHRVYFVVV